MNTKTKRVKTTRKAPSTTPRTAADIVGGIDLLRFAGKIRGHLDAIDAGPSRKDRGIALIEHLETGNMTSSDYILMAQYVRDMDGMRKDETFAGIATFVEDIAWEDRALNRLSSAIEEKHKEYWAKEGDEWPQKGEYWADGEAPEDVEELRTSFDNRFVQLKVAILRRNDENEMADLLLNDPNAFLERVEKGMSLADERKKQHEKAE